eukprot:TRINITY_DN10031_c0_g1_i2.p1 TRINITY_DN10031_c0_g1~~TRINITY_DN10031_c0_g1_i2.p1  ORF type:complete len:319 (-),score=88.10 TRINITY_DN10031_c0_g1_i2:72-1028(-)
MLPQIESAPQSSNISIRDMWNVSQRITSVWGIPEYKCPKSEVDPIKKKQEEEFAKGKKLPAPRALKQKGFIDEVLRTASVSPGPNYNVSPKWGSGGGEKKKAPNMTKRNTYIDQIFRKEERNASPSAHSYFQKTDKDVAEQIAKDNKNLMKKGSERISFLADYEYLSSSLPGPGEYNIDEKKKVEGMKMKPSDWIKKDKEAEEKRKNVTLPSIWTYTPTPVTFQTFEKIAVRSKDEKGGKAKGKFFGTERRFDYDLEKSDKKKEKDRVELSPGPGKYDVVSIWPGKVTAADKDKKGKSPDILNKITKTPDLGIYYSHD